MRNKGKRMVLYIISYIGFMQVIRADMTCLGYIFPEPKADKKALTHSLTHRNI